MFAVQFFGGYAHVPLAASSQKDGLRQTRLCSPSVRTGARWAICASWRDSV